MDKSKTELIGKLDVVERQLKEAIKLFFEKRDIVTIHTIVASAHQILFDLGDKDGVVSALKNKNNISSDEFWEYVKKINYPYNFFKHADRDPDKKINVVPLKRFSSDFILDGVVMFQKINGKLFIEGKIFWAWFLSNFKEEFKDIPEDSSLGYLKGLELGDKNFEWILNLIEVGQFEEEFRIE